MPDFIYDFVLMTIIGGIIVGVSVGLILLAFKKIRWKTFFFKFRLRITLKNYIKKRVDEKMERKYVLKLGKLIDKVLKKVNLLEKFGFQPFSSRGIGNNKFRIYLKSGFRFTIKDLKHSQAFFSNNFEELTLKKSVDAALYNFIEHLKEKEFSFWYIS